jgi:hypothetical protein
MALLTLGAFPTHGFIRVRYSLGRIASESSTITVVRIAEIQTANNVITFRKVRDIRGKHPSETIRQTIGRNGEFNYQGAGASATQIGESARDWRDIMEWAQVGKEAVLFSAGGPCEVCIGNYWYQVVPEGSDWRLLHSEPTFALSFAGRVPNLIASLDAMQAGQEAVVPCMVPSDLKGLLERTARIQRMKVSLKILDYNPERDFAGWGDSGQMRPVTGMPGFTHYGALAMLGPGPAGVAAADFTGDGKPDLCLFSEERVALLENQDGNFTECLSPVAGGARGAAWGDCNSDGRPDLLLATPAGPRLLVNQGGGKFLDCTSSLPTSSYPHVTAAVWIGGPARARPDILLADGFRGLRLCRNRTPAQADATSDVRTNCVPPVFEDVSDAVGLGMGGTAGKLKGDPLVVADVNGDGLDDVLFSAGTGVLLLQTREGFAEVPNSGIAYRTGGVTPAFGDCNGDGRPDLFAPQANAPGRLFLNDGAGRFHDATARAGDLAKPLGVAVCAVWSDFCQRGRVDLLVGCARGPNRYFRNNGNGTFTDAGDEIGLYRGIYNTSSLCALDINQDGVADLIMGNTGGESALLLGSRRRLDAPPAGRVGDARKGMVAYAAAGAR